MTTGEFRERSGATQGGPLIVGRETIFTGWNSLEIVTVEAQDRNGATQTVKREVIDHGDAAAVLAVDAKRGVAIMVRQWRAPLLTARQDGFLLEACAGIIDPGETPEEAARREAEEEIGLRIASLRKVGSVYSSAGILTERMHLYLADVSEADRAAPGGGKSGEGEDIEVVEMPLADLFEAARRGDIEDAKTLILVQRLMIEEMRSVRPARVSG